MEAVQCVIEMAEEKLERKLTETEEKGVWNCGTLMFLEVAEMHLQSCKTKDEAEKWAAEMDGFSRGEDVKQQYIDAGLI